MSTPDKQPRSARRKTLSPAYLLEDLSRIDTADDRIIATLAQHRETVVPALLALMTERSGWEKLRASNVLLHLGVTAGTCGMIEVLSQPDEAMRAHALRQLTSLPYHQDKGGYQVPLDQDRVFAAVDPLLETDDMKLRILAAGVIERLRTPAAAARMTALIADPAIAIRVRAACWLAESGDALRALTAIDAMLLLPDLDDHHRYWLIQALAAVCEKDAAEIGQQAARVAMKYIRSNLAHDDNRTANHVWNCLRGIAVAAPSDEKDLLRQILDSNIAWWVRGIALQRLAGLEGAAGIERLCGALKDRQLRSAAVEALGKQARGTNDPRLMQALAEALEAAREPEFTTTVIQAMLDVGTVPRPILERAISRVDPDTAMTLHWLLNDIRPRRLAQRLVAAGIMALPAKSKLAKYTAAWRKERNAANILRNMLADADRLSGLSCKTDQMPADHADLLRQLARICPPKLAFTDAEQTLEADGGRCRVSFVFDRREHSFVAENRGRYYDLRAIMAGVNKALGGIGREERLFQLYSGGETALMTIALDAPFRAAVQELRIPLEEDPGSPERAGTGYTRHVLSTA